MNPENNTAPNSAEQQDKKIHIKTEKEVIATMGLRAYAYSLDLVMTVMFFIIGSTVTLFAIQLVTGSSVPQNITMSVSLIFLFIGQAYMLVKDVTGASFGKRITHIKIVSADEYALDPLNLILRNLTSVIFPIEFIIALRDPEHRRLTDRWFGMKVIISGGKRKKSRKK